MKKTDEPFDAARPLTADKNRPIPGYFWTRDGRYILFVQDNDGDENYNIHAVNPADEPAAGKQVPEARNLTDLEGVRAAIYSVPKSIARHDLRRPPTTGILPGTTCTGWTSPAERRPCCARTKSASRRGSSTCRGSCAWRCAPPTTATPRS